LVNRGPSFTQPKRIYLQRIDKESGKPGGRTEAALNVFNTQAISEEIEEGLFAAFNRAKEPGN
jgi:hypothetical protein